MESYSSVPGTSGGEPSGRIGSEEKKLNRITHTKHHCAQSKSLSRSECEYEEVSEWKKKLVNERRSKEKRPREQSGGRQDQLPHAV